MLSKGILLLPIAITLLFSSEKNISESFIRNENKSLIIEPQDSTEIDIKNIQLYLSVDWEKKQVKGSATIKFKTPNTINKIQLDAAYLGIESIQTTEGKNLKYEYEGGEKTKGLIVYLDTFIQNSSDQIIKIQYHSNWSNESDPYNPAGSYGKGIRYFGPTFTEPKKRKQLWSMGEPISNCFWFPCNESLEDIRTTDITIIVPDTLMVIANGILKNKSHNSKETTFQYLDNIAHPNYLTSITIGEYIDVKQQYKDVEIHNFGYPDEKDAVEASVKRLPDMLSFFSNLTGKEYPFPTYSQVFVQDYGGFVGAHSLSTITENMVDDDRTHDDFYYLWDLTEAEAAAQQWFGNYIRCKDWNEIWLSKSFAHYFNGLYNEYKNGKDEFLFYQMLFDQNSVYLADWKSGYKRPIITTNQPITLDLSINNYSTIRGALVLHMLRKQLGEEKWVKTIQTYLKEFGGKAATTKDFIKITSEVNQKQLDWFFDQWLYKIGHPIFDVSYTYDTNEKQILLTVKQIQKKDSNSLYEQNDYYKGSIDISINGIVEKVWIDPKQTNTYTFPLPSKPKWINFDVESTWIKEVHFKKSSVELIDQLLLDKDITSQNWALNELVKIHQDSSTISEVKKNIKEALKQRIRKATYWRMKNTCLRNLISLYTQETGELLKPPTDIITILKEIIENENSWNRASAITFLGLTKESKYEAIYINALNDNSDRVINAAAISLGRSKSKLAFAALVSLATKPSWKNQSLISTLNGLKELGDKKGIPIALRAIEDKTGAHWTLSTPIWDYRIAAAETIAHLGDTEAAFPVILERLNKSLEEKDVNDIFSNLILINVLKDKRGIEAYDFIENSYKKDSTLMSAIKFYRQQFIPTTK